MTTASTSGHRQEVALPCPTRNEARRVRFCPARSVAVDSLQAQTAEQCRPKGIRGKWRVIRRWAIAVVLLALLAPALHVPEQVAAARNSFVEQTGHNVSDPILRFYQRHGGLPILGYPLTEAYTANGLTVQYFERARLEVHPDQPAGTQVEGGLLGRELVANRLRESAFVPVAGGPGFFPATGHTLQHGFADFWRDRGALPLFGYPLSEEFRERSTVDGRAYTVQYFERARFEWRPDYPAGQQVALGLLGAERLRQIQPAPADAARAVPLPPPAPRSLRIPVLEYHDVGYGRGTYQVTMPAFLAQLDWLLAAGFTTVTLDDVYDYLYQGGDLPPKPVIITFDDGRASQWDAALALNARGMTGVFFVMGGGTALSGAQLRQLVAWGHEVEAHSMTHPALTGLTDEQLAYEVAGSKQALETALGRPVHFFAYPYGNYDSRVIDAVAAAGYRGGIAAWGGTGWSPDLRWQEPRVMVSGYDTLEEFIALVTH